MGASVFLCESDKFMTAFVVLAGGVLTTNTRPTFNPLLLRSSI